MRDSEVIAVPGLAIPSNVFAFLYSCDLDFGKMSVFKTRLALDLGMGAVLRCEFRYTRSNKVHTV